MRNLKLLIIFLVFSFISLSLPSFAKLSVDTFFSPYQGPEKAIVKAISEADRNIDIAIYNFSNSAILDALAKAKGANKKLKIRMIFDDAANDDKDKPTDISKADRSKSFKEMGIEVRYVKKIMHHKFMIVDGFPKRLRNEDSFRHTVLFTGSGNFSKSANGRYDENYMLIQDDPYLTTEFQKEFSLMWNYSYQFPSGKTFKKPSAYSSVDFDGDPRLGATFTSANFKKSLRFSKNGKHVASSTLSAAMKRAKKSIYVATGHFRLMALAKALIEAKKKNPNLDVRVVVDSQEYLTESSHRRAMQLYDSCIDRARGKESKIDACDMMGRLKLARFLAKNGIDLRIKYYSYIWFYPTGIQMHNKYVIIDGEKMLGGSYNWSTNAEYNTFENVVHVQGRELQPVVESYTKNFLKLWKLNQDRLDSHIAAVRRQKKIPLHFTPMSLSISQIDHLRSVLSEEVPGFFRKAKDADRYWVKGKGPLGE